jgi:hypothetical protein
MPGVGTDSPGAGITMPARHLFVFVPAHGMDMPSESPSRRQTATPV